MTTLTEERIEQFNLTDQESGVVATDGHAGEAGADWADIWSFQLPAGFTYRFTNQSVFSAYLAKLAEDLDFFYTDDAGTLVDDTIDINDAGANDVQPFPATQADEDAIYFGQRYPFTSVRVVVGTAGTDLAWTEAWEYYNGSAWVTLTGLSASALTVFTDAAGNVDVSWNITADWAKTTVGGHNLYWVRMRQNGSPGTQATVDPLWTSAQIHGDTPETDNSELVRVVYQDPNKESTWRLMGAVRYQRVKEFQQESKLHHLDIGGAGIIVPENYWITIQAKPTAIIDASSGYFQLKGQRARHALAFGAGR